MSINQARHEDRPLSSRGAGIRASSTALGVLLRHWRDIRGKSQLQLSFDASISQRHISFIESGRSVPGRYTLLTMAEVLDIPLRERNGLLLAAGYAPMYPEAVWDAPEMKTIVDALKRILRQHEPFPALVMDRYWNVLLTNGSAPRFFGHFIDLTLHKQPRNMLHLMFDPNGMRPFVTNWRDTAKSLLERVRREAVGRVFDDKTRDLVTALLAYPDAIVDQKVDEVSNFSPVIPLSFVKDEQMLNYFSMITTVGSPQMVAAQELRVECMFPVDDTTERYHELLMEQNRPA